MQVGKIRLSTWMSAGDNILGMYAFQEGQVNSPERINAKKPKQQAAHNIVVSKPGD